jgi:hypothetical protein
LLWVRFGQPIDKHQEKLDDRVDEIPALWFWLEWVAVPWRPINIVAETHFRLSQTYLDDVLLTLSFIGIALDFLVVACVRGLGTHDACKRPP